MREALAREKQAGIPSGFSRLTLPYHAGETAVPARINCSITEAARVRYWLSLIIRPIWPSPNSRFLRLAQGAAALPPKTAHGRRQHASHLLP